MTCTGYIVTRTALACYYPEKRTTDSVYETIQTHIDACIKFDGNNGYIDYKFRKFGVDQRKIALAWINTELKKEYVNGNIIASLIN